MRVTLPRLRRTAMDNHRWSYQTAELRAAVAAGDDVDDDFTWRWLDHEFGRRGVRLLQRLLARRHAARPGRVRMRALHTAYRRRRVS